MKGILDFLGDHIGIVIGFSIVAILYVIGQKQMSKEKNAKKRAAGDEDYSSNVGGGATFAPNSIDNPELGEQDKVVRTHGWFRRQGVTQPVIKRTEEQQRIVDEYFNIRNYETITCVSAYKRYYKIAKMLSRVLLPLGLVLCIVGFASSGFLVNEAIKKFCLCFNAFFCSTIQSVSNYWVIYVFKMSTYLMCSACC